MTPEKWRRITEVFHAVLAREPEARDALLDEVCAGDPALRFEVDAMLAAHPPSEFRSKGGTPMTRLRRSALGFGPRWPIGAAVWMASLLVV
jgi:hypothetical protein